MCPKLAWKSVVWPAACLLLPVCTSPAGQCTASHLCYSCERPWSVKHAAPLRAVITALCKTILSFTFLHLPVPAGSQYCQISLHLGHRQSPPFSSWHSVSIPDTCWPTLLFIIIMMCLQPTWQSSGRTDTQATVWAPRSDNVWMMWLKLAVLKKHLSSCQQQWFGNITW